MIVEHIKFVLNEKMELMELTKRDSYDEGYLDALDFVLNLIDDILYSHGPCRPASAARAPCTTATAPAS